MQLRNSPDIPILHQLLSKAVQKPGEKQHCNWRHSDGLPFVFGGGQPLKERYVQWQLFCDKSGKRTMLFECVGHDILMVFNQISAAINDLPTSVGRQEESSRVLRARQARAMQAASAEVTVSVTEPDMPKPKLTGTDSDMARLRASTAEHDMSKPKSRATDADIARPRTDSAASAAPAAAAQKAQDLENTLVNFDDQNDDRFKTVETARPVLPKPILSIPDKAAENAEKASRESLKPPQNKPFAPAPVKIESPKAAVPPQKPRGEVKAPSRSEQSGQMPPAGTPLQPGSRCLKLRHPQRVFMRSSKSHSIRSMVISKRLPHCSYCNYSKVSR
ncbi:MAG: hypothetical protein IPP97_08750 [Candidatus Obscuribacter sp.]|nr:hypothetical protein [Candidatus Obscuribacter sp.]